MFELNGFFLHLNSIPEKKNGFPSAIKWCIIGSGIYKNTMGTHISVKIKTKNEVPLHSVSNLVYWSMLNTVYGINIFLLFSRQQKQSTKTPKQFECIIYIPTKVTKNIIYKKSAMKLRVHQCTHKT